MKRSLVPSFLLSSVLLLTGCGPQDDSDLLSPEESFIDDELGETEDGLTQTRLTCTATGAKFVLAPVSATSKTLRGRLTRGTKNTTLSCVNQSTGAVKCAEATPSTVTVTVAASGKTARLSVNATSAAVSLKCVVTPSTPTTPPKPPTPPAPPPALTYADVKPIVDGVCGQCHTEFSTLADIKLMKSNMEAMVASGRMPKNNPTFNTTADGKKLLQWLRTGSDL